MATHRVSLSEAAAYVGVPEATLRFWRHQGRGPRGFRVGRRVVFDVAELDRWLTEQAAVDRQTPTVVPA